MTINEAIQSTREQLLKLEGKTFDKIHYLRTGTCDDFIDFLKGEVSLSTNLFVVEVNDIVVNLTQIRFLREKLYELENLTD